MFPVCPSLSHVHVTHPPSALPNLSLAQMSPGALLVTLCTLTPGHTPSTAPWSFQTLRPWRFSHCPGVRKVPPQPLTTQTPPGHHPHPWSSLSCTSQQGRKSRRLQFQCRVNFIECEDRTKAGAGRQAWPAVGHRCAWPGHGASGSSRSPGLGWAGAEPLGQQSRARQGPGRRRRKQDKQKAQVGTFASLLGRRGPEASAKAGQQLQGTLGLGRPWLDVRPGSSRAGTCGRSSGHRGRRAPRAQSPPS